ncbi:MAG: hypothetical protein KKE73_03840 [Proteobacteria bacterium]|nr:hypothetical protein [Pseudomonadota bacterium]
MDNDQLKCISHEMQTQNNACTEHPIFCVMRKKRIFGVDPSYHDDGYEWRHSDEDWCDGTTATEDLINGKGDPITEEEAEEEGWYRVHYVEIDEFVNPHFTRKAAEEFIEVNAHHLNRPFVYVYSLWRCDEMIAIREHLMQQVS